MSEDKVTELQESYRISRQGWRLEAVQSGRSALFAPIGITPEQQQEFAAFVTKMAELAPQEVKDAGRSRPWALKQLLMYLKPAAPVAVAG